MNSEGSLMYFIYFISCSPLNPKMILKHFFSILTGMLALLVEGIFSQCIEDINLSKELNMNRRSLAKKATYWFTLGIC
jgi:hypothetical protein